MNHYKLPAGVQDLLPEEYYNLSLLSEKLKKKFRLAGCRFVQSSALEYYDTFAEIRNRIPQNKMFKMTDGDGAFWSSSRYDAGGVPHRRHKAENALRKACLCG